MNKGCMEDRGKLGLMGSKGNTNTKAGRFLKAKLWRHFSGKMTKSDALKKESQMYIYEDR